MVVLATIYHLFSILKFNFIHFHSCFYNVWIYPRSHSAMKTIRAPYRKFYFDFPSLLLAYSTLRVPLTLPVTIAAAANTGNTLFTHTFTIVSLLLAFMTDLFLPLSAGEDTFKLQSVQLEAVERQIHELLGKQAQLRKRKATLETSRADVHKSGVCSALLTIPPPLLRVFLCTDPVHLGRDLPRCPSLRHRETPDPGCSSGGCDPGPGRRLLPLRSSRSPPVTASLLSARRNVTLWSSATQSSGTSVLR